MIKRLFSIVPLIWALGFAAFVVFLPRPAGDVVTDGVTALTGGPGRIERGLEVIERNEAKRLLISGVNRSVKRKELAHTLGIPVERLECCVDLGRQAVDTRSNAQETANWLKRRGYKSVRLVTTDWHMRRARYELSRAVRGKVVIVPDAVRSQASFSVLFREYHKYLLSHAGAAVGL
ncbi:YdcF family protein [Sphingomonas sp. C3-2]|uniref:YdcF family protein n=1 Tax=Sphingomonas sp. C3-2 TaxID=3062169 RepID=UPI00294B5783|nr:YdcF family protein [Sphingomonas sp. C3-2]WOK35199.1 YdcF family protein [Sphingomonas sp. C3-2]